MLSTRVVWELLVISYKFINRLYMPNHRKGQQVQTLLGNIPQQSFYSLPQQHTYHFSQSRSGWKAFASELSILFHRLSHDGFIRKRGILGHLVKGNAKSYFVFFQKTLLCECLLHKSIGVIGLLHGKGACRPNQTVALGSIILVIGPAVLAIAKPAAECSHPDGELAVIIPRPGELFIEKSIGCKHLCSPEQSSRVAVVATQPVADELLLVGRSRSTTSLVLSEEPSSMITTSYCV